MRRPSVAIMQNGKRLPPPIAALAASCASLTLKPAIVCLQVRKLMQPLQGR